MTLRQNIMKIKEKIREKTNRLDFIVDRRIFLKFVGSVTAGLALSSCGYNYCNNEISSSCSSSYDSGSYCSSGSF